MSTELAEVTNAVAEFDRVAAGLAELQSKYKGVVYEVTTTKGMAEAKEARRAIREPRLDVERIRKTAKAPILALGKKLDSEAARITKALEELECPIDDQIKEEEARKERERQEKVEAEMRRVADLQERVAELRGNRNLSSHSGSVLIADHIQDLEEIVIDDTFEEFRPQAEEAKAAGLAWLHELHAAALAHEAEQERIRLEREELARLRAEQAQRDAEDRARREAEERQIRIAREAQEAELRRQREENERQAAAERARIAEEEREAKARRDAEAARQAEQLVRERAEQEAAAKVERDRLAAEEQRLAAQRAEIERRGKEAEGSRKTVAPMTLGGETVRIPSAGEIVRVLASHYKAHPDTILDWIRDMDWFDEVVLEDVA